MPTDKNPCCDDTDGCCTPPSVARRGFIKATGMTAAMLLANQASVMAGPFDLQVTDHGIPAYKKLSPEWIASLYDRGEMSDKGLTITPPSDLGSSQYA